MKLNELTKIKPCPHEMKAVTNEDVFCLRCGKVLANRKEQTNYSQAFKELVSISVRRDICHEDVSAWNAPGECHNDVERMYGREYKEWTEKFGITEVQLCIHFSANMLERAVNKLHSLQCPFCQ